MQEFFYATAIKISEEYACITFIFKVIRMKSHNMN